jgi:hypothetical protein
MWIQMNRRTIKTNDELIIQMNSRFTIPARWRIRAPICCVYQVKTWTESDQEGRN